MKKALVSLVLAVCMLVSVLSFAGCSDNTEDTVTLNVYNWGEYIDLDTLEMFTEQTGIEVNYTTYASNEEMYAKIVSGAASYDVVVPSEYMIAKMIDEGLLAEIHTDKLENYSLIGDEYKGLSYDPEEKYSVPYTWGTVVIVYNTKYVDEEDVKDQSINLLWNEKYAGKILMFDNPRDAFALSLIKLGYSLNSTNPDEWQEAAEELRNQKDILQAYVMDQIFDKMISEEAYIAPYYAGDAIVMMEENEDLAAYVPVEGANMFFDSMCILKTSEHKEEAEKFIDFMCSTEIAVMNAEEVWYAIPQLEAYELLEPEQKDDPMVYPPQEVLDRCEVFVNLPQDIMQLQSKLWISLKTEY
ncbi:MAG: spermidine/putrescine ABC transporter substrate-binding protein [Clostridia bacterium]|nr:spermidine/putrescine ABC transporter substrate-binding protein [Clostridia bacterium]